MKRWMVEIWFLSPMAAAFDGDPRVMIYRGAFRWRWMARLVAFQAYLARAGWHAQVIPIDWPPATKKAP